MKATSHAFLPEPTWTTLPDGRVRCVETGHDMTKEAQTFYSITKKCRSALFDLALKQRRSPLNFFEQSSENKDKIVCKLTGVVLNKKEDAVWKHMMGKNFEAKLAEIETEKGRARGDVEMAECFGDGSQKKKENLLEDMSREGTERMSTGEDNRTVTAEDPEGGVEEASSSDGSEFWVPPAGDRWDFDNGEDRWSLGDKADECLNEDTEMVDGDDLKESSSCDGRAPIRTKRAPTGQRKQIKGRKIKRSRQGSAA